MRFVVIISRNCYCREEHMLSVISSQVILDNFISYKVHIAWESLLKFRLWSDNSFNCYDFLTVSVPP